MNNQSGLPTFAFVIIAITIGILGLHSFQETMILRPGKSIAKQTTSPDYFLAKEMAPFANEFVVMYDQGDRCRRVHEIEDYPVDTIALIQQEFADDIDTEIPESLSVDEILEELDMIARSEDLFATTVSTRLEPASNLTITYDTDFVDQITIMIRKAVINGLPRLSIDTTIVEKGLLEAKALQARIQYAMSQEASNWLSQAVEGFSKEDDGQVNLTLPAIETKIDSDSSSCDSEKAMAGEIEQTEQIQEFEWIAEKTLRRIQLNLIN